MRPGFHRLLVGNNSNNQQLLLPNEVAPYSLLCDDNGVEWSDFSLNEANEHEITENGCSHPAESGASATFSLLDFPVEVLAHILSFVDKETLFSRCSVVCSRLYVLLKSKAFWTCELERLYNAKEMAWITSRSQIDYGRLVVCQPFRRNLIKNCCGELKSAKHWAISQLGDYQLAVEINKSSQLAPGIGIRMTMTELNLVERPRWLDLPASKSCFATSFAIFDMEQIVDFDKLGCQLEILDELRPPIAIGEWRASQFDSELLYRLDVVLLDSNGLELARHSCDNPLGGQWRPVSFVFSEYPSGVRQVLFRHSSVDPRYNCDQFGAKFAGATVKLLFPPEISDR